MRLLLLVFVCLSASCGSQKRLRDQDIPGKSMHPFKFPFRNHILEYSIFDPECQGSASDTALLGLPVGVYSEGEIRERSMPRSVSSGLLGLTSKPVIETSYGLTTLRRFEHQVVDGQETVIAGDSLSLLDKGDALRVCQVDDVFPRNSVEGVAATTNYLVDRTWKFYQELPSTILLQPLRIEVLIQMVDHHSFEADPGKSYNTYKTDNAAYGRLKDIPRLFIFPRSQEALDLGFFTKFALWESPIVMSHEFSHHIFSSYMDESSQKNKELLSAYITQKKPTPYWSKERREINYSERILFLTAIDEGFADLFATYANGDKPDLLEDHSCLEKNRDIKYSSFEGAIRKDLTSSIIDQFRNETAPAPSDCRYPDFNDVHTIGAIWSHGLDKIMGDLDATSKADALLRWLPLFFESHLDSFKIEDLVSLNALQTFIDRDGPRSSLPLDQCQLIEGSFSGLLESESLELYPERWPSLSYCRTLL